VTSRRLSWHADENALTRALAARRAAGQPVVDLTESNPTRLDLPLPADHGERILRALADPAALSYEPDPKGLRAAREAVARYYEDSVDPERIVLTASSSEAYSLLFKLLCDPGDQVLVPEPSYPLFGWLTSLDAVQTVPYELRWDGEWHLDFGSLQAALDAAPRARAVLIVNPGNPTGAFLKGDERDALAALCAARGLPIISDEVFADFGYAADPRRVRTLAAFDDVLSFSLSGLSKVAGLPQLKLGWCAVSGPREEAERAVAQLELAADTYLSVGAPVQHAAPVLLESRRPFQRALLARVRTNLATLRAARPGTAPWDVLPAEAGWSAILSVPRAVPEEELALRLLDRGVLVHPGYFFDFPSGAHAVVSLLPREDEFAAAAAVLAGTIGG
jgi:aspartate/methionine/tyrosine aminotransferase